MEFEGILSMASGIEGADLGTPFSGTYTYADITGLSGVYAFGTAFPTTGFSLTSHAPTPVWPLWQRVLFRFFFVYLLLQISPWDWFGSLPGVPFITGYIQRATDWAVTASNARIFHVRDTLVPVNGSGDTSYAWAQVWMFLSPIFYFGLPRGAEQYEWMLRINPIYHLLVLYRAILIFTPASLAHFPWASLVILAAVAFAVAFAGYRLFVRFKADFADEL